MKKVLIIVAAFVSLHAMAQEQERPERSQFTPEQRATLQTKRMTLALDLSAAQQEQVQELHLNQAKMRTTQIEERKARKASAESEKPTSEERYAMQIARLDQQIAHKSAMKSILSAAQYERWEKRTLRNRKHRKGKRKHEKHKPRK